MKPLAIREISHAFVWLKHCFRSQPLYYVRSGKTEPCDSDGIHIYWDIPLPKLYSMLCYLK